MNQNDRWIIFNIIDVCIQYFYLLLRFLFIRGRCVWSSEDTCRSCFSPSTKLRWSSSFNLCPNWRGLPSASYFIIVSFVGKSWFLIINIISCFHLQWKVAPKALIIYNEKTAGFSLSHLALLGCVLPRMCMTAHTILVGLLNFTFYCVLMPYFIDLVFHLFQILKIVFLFNGLFLI